MAKRKKEQYKKTEQEFDQKIIDLARVTRVMAGGKRLRFRATVAIGDKKGRVGIGVAKGKDVTLAISKSVNVAKKNLIQTPIINGTLPCDVKIKYGAAKVLLRSAKPGVGIIAGGAVRTVLELSGLSDVVAKIMGTNNKVNNVKATIEGLKEAGEMLPKKREMEKKKKNNKIVEEQKSN